MKQFFHRISAFASSLLQRCQSAAPGAKAVAQSMAEVPTTCRNLAYHGGIFFRRVFHVLHVLYRRLSYLWHHLTEGHRAAGPISFLLVAVTAGASLTLTTLYTSSYAVFVDGQEMALVDDQSSVTQLVARIESQGSELLGYEYQVTADFDYQFNLSLNTELTDSSAIETYLYQQLEGVGASLRQYHLMIDGVIYGVANDPTAFETLLEEIQAPYCNYLTTSASFVEYVEIVSVYGNDTETNLEDLATLLTANTTGETTYTVQAGDTFNAIAYNSDMSSSELQALNPDVNINSLTIGQTLNVKQIVPFLSVVTTENTTFLEDIACPIVTVDDPTIYTGTSKVVEEGTPGEALVTATITYVNGYENSRVVESSETITEPTETTMAVGTMERPKTASYGSYIWPCSGTITSYFGTRYIFGSYSYHSGIDISVSYGTSIKAADGGTVTTAGYEGTYGYLVVITHDNGTQTYYAHNSSLLVSKGDKVYQGQVIAKAGSTGRSTGNHCHFEIRVNGTAVNPLSYLP